MNVKAAIRKALPGVSVFLLAVFSMNSIIAGKASTFGAAEGYPGPGSGYPAPSTATLPGYPIPPPMATATVVPSLPSTAAQKAMEFIAARDGIPFEALTVYADHPITYPSLGRQFQVVTLLDYRPDGQVYKMLVDLGDNSIVESPTALLDAESQAYQAEYGRLEVALYQRLQGLSDNDSLPVVIWIAPYPGETLADLQAAAFAAVAAKYPEAQAALEQSGKPMDTDNSELAHTIEVEYAAIIDERMRLRTQPLVTELEQKGFTVTRYQGAPIVIATLPKFIILDLGLREGVTSISLADSTEKPELDSAVPNTRAPIVWARGLTGSGITIAILENGNVDRSNSYLHHAALFRSAPAVSWHTTMVASSAASFHDAYRGIAFDANILSAGEDGTDTDTVAALQWARNQGARTINFSAGFQYDNNLNWTDRAFDYWARLSLLFITKSAGNSGGSISSPGKGWNVFTVGAYDDANNTVWDDDQMWPGSSSTNPISLHGDREKPEIVAVGASITALADANITRTESGTSLSAPQVAGLSALLRSRNFALLSWPEAMRAIIMASAFHNIRARFRL
jgi:subtilisin family serine protease